MATEEFNEDSIDTEALQAQIDLSMSYAQNLITSWMEPTQLTTSTRRKDLEKELLETMKRPPRLGVGASADEATQSLGRETARLKGKLAGSKRSREEVDESHGSLGLSDAEDESRAGAIYKKARPDPFGAEHGKKRKKKQSDGTSSLAKPELLVKSTPPLTGLHPVKLSTPVSEVKPESDAAENAHSTAKKKNKKRKGLSEPAVSQEAFLIRSPLPTLPQGQDELPSLQIAAEPMIASPKLLVEQRSTTSTLSTELCSPDVVAAHLLDLPLLNLNGPPQSDGDSDAPSHSPITSPKKKRKRKKKKKNLAVADSTEGVASTFNTAL